MKPASNPRILVVDDEEAILETMVFTFEDQYEVLTATNAHQALALLDEKNPVATVITDQRMPDMTGVELLARVCENHPSTTRIILTGFADLDAIVQAINEGHVYAYVAKPWEPEELKQLVRRAVEHHRLLLENERLLEHLGQANVFLEAAMDEISIGAFVVDADGVVRAANRPAREYMGLQQDPRGHKLEEVLAGTSLSRIHSAVRELEEQEASRYEELDLACGDCSLRLRIAVRQLSDAAGSSLGRVILLREVSHEPLRRAFEELLQELVTAGAQLKPRLERALEELRELGRQVQSSGISSPGMDELGERLSRTLTALENWLAVDEALGRSDYPDARVLVERMRIATARWPLPDEIPERVRELGRRVESYYESGENPGQRVL